MAFNRDEWALRVSDAAASRDEGALTRLFEEGRDNLGDLLDHAWAEALSAWDASAVTG